MIILLFPTFSNMKLFSHSVLMAAGFLAATAVRADVTMPAIFGDHMVLQQDTKIPVWGWAEPGEEIKVALGKTELHTVADAQGDWRVEFPSRVNTANPTTLTVAGKNSLSFQDVIVGEVWLASGQSNMAFPLGWLGGATDWLKQRGEGNVMQANNPQIRVFFVDGRAAVRPNKIGGGRWMLFSPDAARDFSAVAYFFAEKLQQTLGRPIGIIQSAAGGTPIETWSSKEALQLLPDKKPGLDQVATEEAAFPKDKTAADALLDDFGKRDHEWAVTVEAQFHKDYDQWKKDCDAAKAGGKPLPPEPPYPQTRPKNPNGEPGEYGTLFNGMIYFLAGYPIKGALWYQGEANGPPEYDEMLKNMVTDWRKRWGYDFPFLVVTLANIGDRWPMPTDNGWSGVRDAQEKVSLEVPKMGTAEAIDVGTGHNIHPYDKIDVGQRLAAQALRIAYGQKIVSTGPRFGSMTVEGNKIRIKWKDIGSGLKLAVSPFVSNDPVNDNPALPTDKPLSFDIAGADKKWVVAQAQLDGNDILVWSDQVPQPVAVRYGWAQNPQINLYNKEGFPAVPFRTETWPAEPK
jgi:sialate O-acetylesterase